MQAYRLTDAQWDQLPEHSVPKEWSLLLGFDYHYINRAIRGLYCPQIEFKRINRHYLILKSQLIDWLFKCDLDEKLTYISPPKNYNPSVSYWRNDSMQTPTRYNLKTYAIRDHDFYYINDEYNNLNWDTAPEYEGLMGWSKFLNVSDETVWRWATKCGLRHEKIYRMILIHKSDLMFFLNINKPELKIKQTERNSYLFDKGYVSP